MSYLVGEDATGIGGLATEYAITHDMVVYDTEYLDFADAYRIVGEKLEKSLEQYLKILRGVSELCEGEFSDSLKNFSDIVEKLMANSAEEMLNRLSNDMNAYITRLDEADGEWN